MCERGCGAPLAEVPVPWEALPEEAERGSEKQQEQDSSTERLFPNTLVLLGASVNVNMDSVTEIFLKLLFLLSLRSWHTAVAGNKGKYCIRFKTQSGVF